MSNIQALRSYYRTRLIDMKKSNERAQEALNIQTDLMTNIAYCNQTVKNLNALNESLQGKNAAYISEIIKTLEDAVAYAVNSVLPIKKYDVSLDYKPYRNNGQLRLYLIDEKGNKLPPRIIEGSMLNEVLSFASIIYITLQMGYKRIFYDEAFASANIRSLSLINIVIKYYNSLGIQFVFVSQSPILYANLERTMIELISDGRQIVGINKSRVIPTEEELDIVSQVTDLFDSLTHTRSETDD